MKSALLCCMVLLCTCLTLHAQQQLRPFEASAASKIFTLKNNANAALQNSREEVSLELPDIDGGMLVAQVRRKDDLSPNYPARTNQGARISTQQPVCYVGNVKGIPHSSVLVLSRNNYFYAVVFKNNSAYTIVKSRRSDVYAAQKLDMEELAANSCGVADALPALKGGQGDPAELWDDGNQDKRRCVGIYFEIGYDVYTAFGDKDENVLDYMNEMFSIVSLLYAREGIPTKISEVNIWHTPDPYNGHYATVLSLFTQNTPVVNGQFGHLMKLPGAVTGGILGVAWLNYYEQTFCSSTIQRGYSNLNIETINPFPMYTPTSRLVAHELGHNFGSQHTHYCYWPHGPFEVCASVEPAGCTNPSQPYPAAGASIMSYCAANFVNGFAQYPGNVLRKSYLALPDSCQYVCNVDVSGLVCPTPANLQVQAVSGGYKAQWTNPGVDSFYIELQSRDIGSTQWQTVADATTVNDTFLFTNITFCREYLVRVQSFCGRRAGFFASQTFTAPPPPDDCVSSGTATTNYVQALKINDRENISGNNNGLLNSCFAFNIYEGGDNYFKFTPGNTANGHIYYWRVWMDLNRDNIYDPVNELMYTSPGTSTVRKAAINVPPPGIIGGQFKIRVSMKKDAPPSVCETGFDGEVENYIATDLAPNQDYCFSEGNTDASAWISNVTIQGHSGTVSNPTAQSGGYAVYFPGTGHRSDSTYTFSITCKRLFSFTRLYTKAWIDLNGDVDFDDAGENIFDQSVVPNQAYSGSFTVPTTQISVRSRMRVITSTQPIAGPCGIHEFGETEDYHITIVGRDRLDNQAVPLIVTNANKVRVYPNPVNGRSFYCTISSAQPGRAVVTLTDISGKKVHAANYMLTASTGVWRINLPSSVRSGMYFVSVQLNGKVYREKVVVQ